jgi:5-methylcytosine-specific restriction enzyme A
MRPRCHQVAIAIFESLEGPDDGAAPSSEWLAEGEDDAPEGRLLTRQHVYRERNRKLVQRKKQQVLRDRGKLECEACGFDFARAYGAHGDGFIECHHTKPVATLRANDRTHLKDLALLCANCHRMIHRGKKWLEIKELLPLIAHLGSKS